MATRNGNEDRTNSYIDIARMHKSDTRCVLSGKGRANDQQLGLLRNQLAACHDPQSGVDLEDYLDP